MFKVVLKVMKRKINKYFILGLILIILGISLIGVRKYLSLPPKILYVKVHNRFSGEIRIYHNCWFGRRISSTKGIAVFSMKGDEIKFLSDLSTTEIGVWNADDTDDENGNFRYLLSSNPRIIKISTEENDSNGEKIISLQIKAVE